MISLSKVISDRTYGNVIFNEISGTDIDSMTARITRTATLDGGVYINHSGVSHGDRNLKIKARINSAQHIIVKNMIENETMIIVSTKEGVFLSAIQYLTINNGVLELTIFVKSKEN